VACLLRNIVSAVAILPGSCLARAAGLTTRSFVAVDVILGLSSGACAVCPGGVKEPRLELLHRSVVLPRFYHSNPVLLNFLTFVSYFYSKISSPGSLLQQVGVGSVPSELWRSLRWEVGSTINACGDNVNLAGQVRSRPTGQSNYSR
jgi:hypothetical protein